MLAQLELGRLPQGHVDRLLAARKIPLPVQLRGREGERYPVLASVRGDRHRAGAQPEAGAVDAPRGLDSGRQTRHGRYDVERIAERDVVVAAANASLG